MGILAGATVCTYVALDRLHSGQVGMRWTGCKYQEDYSLIYPKTFFSFTPCIRYIPYSECFWRWCHRSRSSCAFPFPASAWHSDSARQPAAYKESRMVSEYLHIFYSLQTWIVASALLQVLSMMWVHSITTERKELHSGCCGRHLMTRNLFQQYALDISQVTILQIEFFSQNRMEKDWK